LCCVVWWLHTNVSDACATSIFRVELHGEQKVDIYRQCMRRGRGRWVMVSQWRAWEESPLNRALGSARWVIV